MATTTTTGARKYLIWGSVTVLLSIGGFLLWKRNKNKKQKGECEKKGGTWDEVTKTCIITPTVVSTPSTSGSSSGNANVQTETLPSTGLSKVDGDAFRVWVNEKYPSYAKEIDLSKMGPSDNNIIRKAYAKYGTEWKNSKEGKITVLPTNVDSFNKLASSIATPVYVMTDGRRMTIKQFTIKGVSSFDFLNSGNWKIEFYEQATVDPSKQSYRIVTGKGAEFQNGYWSNNGKTLRVINGTNKGSSSTTDSIIKTIGNVISKEILWA